jgi:hypothetical protein
MTEAVRTYETSVYFNETTQRYILEGCHHTRRRENLKSHIQGFVHRCWMWLQRWRDSTHCTWHDPTLTTVSCLAMVSRPHTPRFSFLGLRQGLGLWQSSREVRARNRDVVVSVNEHTLRGACDENVFSWGVCHAAFEATCSTTDINLNVGQMLWINSFSSI